MEARDLYNAALAADNRLSVVVAEVTEGQRDRWTMTGEDLIRFSELRDALREKLDADAAWLAFLRGGR